MNDLSALPDLAVVNFVNSQDSMRLKAVLDSTDFVLLLLNGAAVHDKASFLRAMSTQLLEGQPATNWDSLSERLEDVLLEIEGRRIAFLWTDAHRMLEGGLSDLMQAGDILARIARAQYQNGNVFVTYFIGEGPNFPPLRTAD